MKQRPQSPEDCFFGSATVGERGQISIPSEARHEMGIEPGDKLLIMRHPVYEGLMLAKFEAMRGFLDEFGKTLERFEQESESK